MKTKEVFLGYRISCSILPLFLTGLEYVESGNLDGHNRLNLSGYPRTNVFRNRPQDSFINWYSFRILED